MRRFDEDGDGGFVPDFGQDRGNARGPFERTFLRRQFDVGNEVIEHLGVVGLECVGGLVRDVGIGEERRDDGD